MGVWDYSLKTLIAYAPEAFVAMMRHQAEIQATLQTALGVDARRIAGT